MKTDFADFIILHTPAFFRTVASVAALEAGRAGRAGQGRAGQAGQGCVCTKLLELPSHVATGSTAATEQSRGATATKGLVNALHRLGDPRRRVADRRPFLGQLLSDDQRGLGL